MQNPPPSHTRSITVSPLSIPFYLCFSCTRIPVINVKPLLTLWSYAWGRIESWPQPFSKGAPNPAFLTRLLSVSGIRGTLSPVIYHNDETQLWATDSCSPRDGNSRGDWDIFRSASGGILCEWGNNSVVPLGGFSMWITPKFGKHTKKLLKWFSVVTNFLSVLSF